MKVPSARHVGFAPDALGERGTVAVEYTILLGFVSIGIVIAMMAIGVPLAQFFLSRQSWLLLPFP